MLSELVDDFGKTLRQLADPAVLRVLLVSMAVAGLAFVAIWFAAHALLAGLFADSFAWVQLAAGLAGGALVALLAWFLYPSLAALIAGLFTDTIAEAVERRHYPTLPPARGLSLALLLWIGTRFTIALLVASLLLLPLQLFVGVGQGVALIVFGYLVGAAFFDQAARRRMRAAQAATLRRSLFGQVWIVGIGLMLLFSVPVVNLLTPVIGTALMTHLVARRLVAGAPSPAEQRLLAADPVARA